MKPPQRTVGKKAKTTQTTKDWCRRKNKKFTLLSRVSIATAMYLWLKKTFQEWAAKIFFDSYVSCKWVMKLEQLWMPKFQCFLFVLSDHIFVFVQFEWLYLKNRHCLNNINLGGKLDLVQGFLWVFQSTSWVFLSISRKLASAKIIRKFSIHKICEI